MLAVVLHVAAGIAFSAVLLAALGLIVVQLESHRALIAAVLRGEARSLVRPWPVRVRTVSRLPAQAVRIVPQSRATA